jgi:ankyrin repeat protein
MLSATLAVAADRDLRLVEASRNDDVAAVKSLLAAGVDVNAPSGDGATALHWAAQNDDLALADLLLAKGAKVNAVTDLDITPLWIAASNANTAILLRLLEARADPNIAPPTNGTPLMIAARLGDSQAVKALLAHGADPNAQEGAHGQTALMWAVSDRHPEVVRQLLEAHADVRARTRSWPQRVLLCCQYYESEADGDATVQLGGFTPLLFAAQDGDVESTKLLIAAGADVKDTAADGSSLLHIAAHAGQSQVGALLLSAGAEADAAGPGHTALHIAAASGDTALVKALLDHGANPNVRQQKGSPSKRSPNGHSLDYTMVGATPYFLAVRAAHLDVMRLLVARGGDPSIPIQDGRTALMVLGGEGTIEGPSVPDARKGDVVKLAVQLGSPVDQTDARGDTALHVAGSLRRDAMVQALVDSGAGLDVRNRDGETPLAVAMKPPPQIKGSGFTDEYLHLLNHKGTVELLRKLGAKS